MTDLQKDFEKWKYDFWNNFPERLTSNEILEMCYTAGVKREREACIKECERQLALQLSIGSDDDVLNQAERCLNAIRNRTKEE